MIVGYMCFGIDEDEIKMFNKLKNKILSYFHIHKWKLIERNYGNGTRKHKCRKCRKTRITAMSEQETFEYYNFINKWRSR